MNTAAQTVKRWELNRVRNLHENPPGVLVSAEDYTALERRVQGLERVIANALVITKMRDVGRATDSWGGGGIDRVHAILIEVFSAPPDAGGTR